MLPFIPDAFQQSNSLLNHKSMSLSKDSSSYRAGLKNDKFTGINPYTTHSVTFRGVCNLKPETLNMKLVPKSG